MRAAEALAALGVSTVMTSPVGDDPARYLEETFGPAMERMKAVEATPPA